jgi:hypothetical protein
MLGTGNGVHDIAHGFRNAGAGTSKLQGNAMCCPH